MTPSGWTATTLGAVADLSGGTTPSKANDEFWEDGSIPWATPTDLTALPAGQLEIETTASFITEAALSGSSIKLLPPGSVLMTSRATLGYAAINRVPMCTNQGFCNFLPGDGLNAKFLVYWLTFAKPEIERRAAGSTFLEVSKAAMRALPMILPPLTEQQKIAAILGSVDDAIQATQAVIDQTRKVKQGLLQQLLTRGIGHTRFKQTEIGEIPDSWKVVSFSALATLGPQNGIYKSKEAYGSGLQMLDMGELFRDDVILAAERRRLELTDVERAKFTLAEGDLLFARRSLVAAGSGKCSVVSEMHEYPVFESSIIRFRLIRQLGDPMFYHYWWNSPIGQRARMEITRQVAVSGVTGKDLEEVRVPLPPLQEQQQIVGSLQNVDSSIAQLSYQLGTLESLKTGLMADLLTGRKRVEVSA